MYLLIGVGFVLKHLQFEKLSENLCFCLNLIFLNFTNVACLLKILKCSLHSCQLLHIVHNNYELLLNITIVRLKI